MFEGIPMIYSDNTPWVTNIDQLEGNAPKVFAEVNYTNSFNRYGFFRNCLFRIDGSSQSAMLRTISDYAEEALYYIQSYAITQSGPFFFTKRADTDSYLLLFTYSGAGIIEYNGQLFHLKEGDGMLIDCRRPHLYKTDGESWKHGDLHIYSKRMEYLYQQFEKYDAWHFHQAVNGKFQADLEKALRAYSDYSPIRELLLSSRLEQMLLSLLIDSAEYKDQVAAVPDNLKYLIRYIDYHYTEHLTLDFLADFSGLNKQYLCRLFKKYFHLSPMDYVIRQRLENAKRLLEITDLPANKIGSMVGIDNENYFYRLFNARFGVTPKEYRSSKG